MIYKLPIQHRSSFTSHAVDLFLSVYGGVFSLVSAEDGLDPRYPTARLAADLRPGAIFVNNPSMRVAATDGMRFEFEIGEAEVLALEKWQDGEPDTRPTVAW